ncbi:MAG: hypothetical protein HQK75_18305 [Candidatus Magnetomorum sp.]|nr:hypothetical protein [Candidatus Magnetomorum sp.]
MGHINSLLLMCLLASCSSLQAFANIPSKGNKTIVYCIDNTSDFTDSCKNVKQWVQVILKISNTYEWIAEFVPLDDTFINQRLETITGEQYPDFFNCQDSKRRFSETLKRLCSKEQKSEILVLISRVLPNRRLTLKDFENLLQTLIVLRQLKDFFKEIHFIQLMDMDIIFSKESQNQHVENFLSTRIAEMKRNSVETNDTYCDSPDEALKKNQLLVYRMIDELKTVPADQQQSFFFHYPVLLAHSTNDISGIIQWVVGHATNDVIVNIKMHDTVL